MKTKSHRIQILETHINRWKGQGVTSLVIGQLIVESVYRLKLNEILETENVLFARNGDIDKCMRTNNQNIRRWLGYADGGIHEDYRKVFLIEPAIVAAMPEDIRLLYLYEVYKDSNTAFSLNQIDESHSQYNYKSSVQSIMKENSEAEISLLNLPENPTLKDVTETRREICESIATSKAALKQLEDKYPDCKPRGEA